MGGAANDMREESCATSYFAHGCPTGCDKHISWADNTTMTDHDADDIRQRGTGPAAAVGKAFPRAGKRADPTEPEVPSAKRTHTRHRQRSVVLIGSAVMALVSIALFLLYETGRHVALSGAAASGSALSTADVRAASQATTDVGRAEPLPSAPAGAGSTTNGSALSASPSSQSSKQAVPLSKAPAHSSDIFRKPEF